MKYIYRLQVDLDEIFVTMGHFLTVQDALTQVKKYDGKDGSRLPSDWFYHVWPDEPEKIEIVKFKIGIIDTDGVTIAKYERTWHWSDDAEHEVWTTKEVT